MSSRFADPAQLEARLLASLGHPVVSTDVDFRVTYWNRSAEGLLGYKASEAVGSDLFDLAGIERGPEVAGELAAELATGVASAHELSLRRKDGTSLRVLACLAPLLDEAATLSGMVATLTDVSERGAVEERMARLLAVIESSSDAIIGVDLDGTITSWNAAAERLYGHAATERVGRHLFADLDAGDLSAAREIFEGLKEGRALEGYENVRARPDGTLVEVATSVYPVTDAKGAFIGAVAISRDMSARKALEKLAADESRRLEEARSEYEVARRRAEQRFDVAFEAGSVGMLIMDLDHRIERVNPALCHFLGRSESELIGEIAESFGHPAEGPRSAGLGGAESGVPQAMTDVERRYVRPDGEIVSALVHTATVRDASGAPEYMFAQVIDITDRKHVEEELQRLAMHDPLTGLPNRYLLQDRLETALARSIRSHRRVAVLFIDADHFKVVNDSLGHAAGDALLVQLAHRLLRESRSGDTVARFGGDEFVMVCEDVIDAAEAEVIGARVARLFDEPFFIGDQQLYVTVSTGIVIPDAKATPVTVLRDADAAMYRAKEKGRARLEVFDETLRRRAARRLDIEMMLRRALDEEEFRLVFQPIVGLPSERPAGVEALVRWLHPERGLMVPTEFIPAAEETGLIVPLGAWVLDRAVRQLSEWRTDLPGCGDLALSVNLSPRQLLAGDLIARCSDAVTTHGVPADSICLEITEGTVMDDVDVSIPILRRLADLGIRVAVDDFGAGYSSLNYLKRLPVHTLKIDRTFVDGLGSDPDDSAIVRAIVSLGQSLGLELCAEGVETPAQRRELVGLGCHRAQGFLFSPPVPPEHLPGWFSRKVETG